MYVFIVRISLAMQGYWYPTEDFGVEFTVETQSTFFFLCVYYSAKRLTDSTIVSALLCREVK